MPHYSRNVVCLNCPLRPASDKEEAEREVMVSLTRKADWFPTLSAVAWPSVRPQVHGPHLYHLPLPSETGQRERHRLIRHLLPCQQDPDRTAGEHSQRRVQVQPETEQQLSVHLV